MVQWTNEKLRIHGKKETDRTEVLKLIGVLILLTRFEFNSRSDLWQTIVRHKYIPAPSFGNTGMVRQQFDDLMKHLTFSFQPKQRPDDMTSEEYRWLRIGDFVSAFNQHREGNFLPSHLLCVDESISRWYGIGGSWINEGLPCYVAIDRKPESGCEIQNAACGVSGVMLCLKLVRNAEEEMENETQEQQENDGLIHGCKVLKELVQPWFNTNRIVCADSYFAAVSTATEMCRLGLGFIGVVKSATKRFPMQYLSELEFTQRGQGKGVVMNGDDGQKSCYAFVWVDRDRRYFITNTLSLRPGHAIERKRMRQMEPLESQLPPETVELTIAQPKATEVYYETCSAIDRHNRSRHDNLSLEKKFETKDWSMRVNLSILGMIIVDTANAYRKLTTMAGMKLPPQHDHGEL